MIIDKSMIVIEIINMNEGMGPILAASGLHCLGCSSSYLETLEDACTVHGIDVDFMVNKLNEYLSLVG